MYCDQLTEEVTSLFSKLGVNIHIYKSSSDSAKYSAHIVNRFARFYAAKMGGNDAISIIIDSDTIFSESTDNFVGQFEVNDGEECVWGNIEYENTLNNYLFFAENTNDAGMEIKVSDQEKEACYNNIFGQDWLYLLTGFQFNNGVLGFYRCNTVIDIWSDYFVRGLDYPLVCPKDDQVPLAATLRKTKVVCNLLDDKYNSKGEVSGDYTIFHAYGGRWKNEFILAMRVHKYQIPVDLSDFAKLSLKILLEAPAWLTEKLIQTNEPYKYLFIPGYFRYEDIHSFVIDKLKDNSVMVEIGTHRGRSTCYAAELIQSKGIKVQFESIDNYSWENTSIEEVQENLKKLSISSYVTLKKGSSLEVAESYLPESIDYVLLDGDPSYDATINDLMAWWPKVKHAGFLAGDDYSTSRRYGYGVEAAVNNFCKSNDLSLTLMGRGYIIQNKNEQKWKYIY